MRRLDLYWRNPQIPCRDKLITYDMIVKSKLCYGLESAQINDTVFSHRIDPFYKTGLRKFCWMQPQIDPITKKPKYPSDEALY